ncbi:hypothetical protein, partial [Pleomorphochaeta sp. DL1XJH-081]|uniref:hypothetical protein n=1 Tax=Pleomorphochaeta sp. DL1XJH-081 TaxID=3409690 RepID=UPI003BB61A9D
MTETENPVSEALHTKVIDPLPHVEMISTSEISTAACDGKQERLDMARLYNEMSRTVKDNGPNSGLETRKGMGTLKEISDE